ncbi:MAG: MarR family winged helix-turn-helix transcriptional regulator [Pseudomonadota bacterium]
MIELESIIDLLIENIRRIFSFEEWIELDMKFSKSEIFTLFILDKEKELTMTELVEYINSPMSTATGIADRLVKSGCIRRERSEADRRVVVLTPAEKGIELVRKMKEMLQGYISAAIDGLSEEEKQLLANLVFKIFNNLQKRLDEGKPEEQDRNNIRKIEIE